ncbi:ring finger protein-like [Cynocephalus volans]|uniref:ring finger protein-like n=1 Tax=Cynocephalus volans TaxID=110931 RepID=UPI002FCC0326
MWLRPGLGQIQLGQYRVAQDLLGAGTRCWDPSEVYFWWGDLAWRRSVPASGEPCLALRATLTFMSPATPLTALGSLPTYPDSCLRAATPELCPGGPLFSPSNPSSGPASPLCASLGPEHLDPLCQVLADEGDNLGAPQGTRTPDSEPLLGAIALDSAWVLPAGEEGQEQGEEEECPICTEPYGPGQRRPALLNCGHCLCASCLHRLLGTAPSADLGRVCCPLCRQKTPMLEWEICRLQEELLQADGPQCPPPPASPVPPRRDPGPWGSLEHRYQLRFLVGPVGGRSCLPFLPCPPCLGAWLWALRERGPCARCLALLGLLGLELLGLLLIFTPLMLLGLLFMLLDRSGH